MPKLPDTSPLRKHKAAMRKANQKGTPPRSMAARDAEWRKLVTIRDEGVCQAHKYLATIRQNELVLIPSNVAHHILRRKTHKGGEHRFDTGFGVALCDRCHKTEHGQVSGTLKITAELAGEWAKQTFSIDGFSVSRLVENIKVL